MQEKNIFATFPKDKLSTAGVSQLPYLPKLRIKSCFNSKKTHFHSQNITCIVPLSINVHFTVVYIYYHDYSQFLNMVYQVRKKTLYAHGTQHLHLFTQTEKCSMVEIKKISLHMN